jgi:hypothetical protein
MAALDRLWGAVLEDFIVDLRSQTVTLMGRVASGSEAVAHRLEARGVSELRFQNSIPGPWEYTEITEAHVAPSSTGGVSVELVLWSDDAGISISAESASLDGIPLGVDPSV